MHHWLKWATLEEKEKRKRTCSSRSAFMCIRCCQVWCRPITILVRANRIETNEAVFCILLMPCLTFQNLSECESPNKLTTMFSNETLALRCDISRWLSLEHGKRLTALIQWPFNEITRQYNRPDPLSQLLTSKLESINEMRMRIETGQFDHMILTSPL